MILVLKMLFIGILLAIFFQDLKERKVTLTLLVSGILIGGFLHFQKLIAIVFLSNSMVNLIIISLIFSFLWLYAKLKLKKKIQEVFGLGDFLFFCLLAVSLPIVSFLVIFVFSLFFSLVVFMLIKSSLKQKTVPLAGFQSIFFAIVLVFDVFMNALNIYAM
jgi:hypothetical protein